MRRKLACSYFAIEQVFGTFSANGHLDSLAVSQSVIGALTLWCQNDEKAAAALLSFILESGRSRSEYEMRSGRGLSFFCKHGGDGIRLFLHVITIFAFAHFVAATTTTRERGSFHFFLN